ncbi:hypothetical protein [Actinoplanes regularis]|uniref:Uncharacterized protein n=1 Tax=Actinoplanes regularis TaxID=52697 RepID=A0A239E3Q0_9ACTN|nr:hypothetical protein [Actinoplanes regularis]GIE88885.1 hypothetical protein Are01nite_53650 [Actinoplanes regularis]SNS38613.1 hypothetical protein SAMN06264365_114215 [Actinoplanes regularis]
MVDDDDIQPRDSAEIPWNLPPREFVPPPSGEVRSAILALARRWACDRFTIYDTLKAEFPSLRQAHVNYVLREHDLPHLRR